jgi:hypothetical protein
MIPSQGCHPASTSRLPLEQNPRSATEVALAGKTGPTLTGLDGFPVVKVVTRSGCSSAVPLAEDLLLLTRHGLADGRADVLEIAGERRDATLLAAGATDAWCDDWAYVRVDPPVERRVPHVAPAYQLDAGHTLYLLGYWHNGSAATLDDVRRLRRSIIETVVVDHPDHPKAPSRTAFICVEVEHPDALRGMSGGPAVAWDEALGDYVLVGIYRGAWQLLGGDGRHLAAVHLVRRVPEPPP